MNQVKPYLLPLGVMALFCVAYLPAIEIFIDKWSSSDDYAHAFFTVPIAFYMIWQQRVRLLGSAGNPVVGLLLAGALMLAYIFALKLQVPTIIFMTTVGTVVSVLICFGGLKSLYTLGIPILLLVLVIPIPNQVLSMATAELQLRISATSESIIRSLAVPLFREGNILNIPGKSFQVADACSGIRSLISMTTLSLIIGYFTLQRSWSKLVLFIGAVPVAILINIARVVLLVLCYHLAAIDLSEGLPHTTIGIVLFGVGLVLLFLFQRVLERWENRSGSH